MYRILDTMTRKWIKTVPYHGTILTDKMLSSPGRVFKRRSDLSNHITQNLDFYTANANRLEVIEYELTEVSREPISDALKAKKERDKQRAIEERKQLALSKLRRIEELRSEIDKLTGKV